MTRGLNDAERADIADVLRCLREHFHQWPGYEGSEHELVGFAYYEGCGDTACCGDLLAEASPVTLGAALVRRHGFEWVVVGREPGRIRVAHPALAEPIDLAALDGGEWSDESVGASSSRGEPTYHSLANIVRATGGRPADG